MTENNLLPLQNKLFWQIGFPLKSVGVFIRLVYVTIVTDVRFIKNNFGFVHNRLYKSLELSLKTLPFSQNCSSNFQYE